MCKEITYTDIEIYISGKETQTTESGLEEFFE